MSRDSDFELMKMEMESTGGGDVYENKYDIPISKKARRVQQLVVLLLFVFDVIVKGSSIKDGPAYAIILLITMIVGPCLIASGYYKIWVADESARNTGIVSGLQVIAIGIFVLLTFSMGVNGMLYGFIIGALIVVPVWYYLNTRRPFRQK